MFKWIGIITVFLSSAFFGFYKASALKFREKRLLCICVFIEDLAVRIRMGEEMKSIISAIGKDAGFYLEGYEIKFSEDNLTKTDISLVRDFIKELGMGDIEAELKRCNTYKELFLREFKIAEVQMKEKGSLYGKLGIFCGMIIGIVFI